MLRRVRTALALAGLLGSAAAVAGSQPAAADSTVTATTAVNIRSAPNLRARIIGGLYRGQTVTAVRAANGWTTIKFSGSQAYVASRYLTAGQALSAANAINAGTVKVTTTALNLRTGPGLSYRVLSVLPENNRVTLTGKTARGYAEGQAGSLRGWVSTQYLAAANTLPKIIGSRQALADLAIRTTSGAGAKVVGTAKKGTKLSVTGATQSGRAQIIWKNAVRWVTAQYLSNLSVTGPTAPGLPKVVGYRYATAALNIRSNNTDNYTLIAEVPAGTKLAITGAVANGRAQIIFNSAARWVSAGYLSTTPPSSGTLKPNSAVERGLKPNAIKVHRAAMAAWPQITTYYGVRSDPLPDHPSGHALDLMIPNYKSAAGKALGYSVSAWAKDNATKLGIEYVIWNQHIWNIRRDKEGWRYMADRGGDSANHKNHVHITVF